MASVAINVCRCVRMLVWSPSYGGSHQGVGALMHSKPPKPPTGGRPTQSGHGRRELRSDRCRYRSLGAVSTADRPNSVASDRLRLWLWSLDHTSTTGPCQAGRPDVVSSHRGAARHERTPRQAVPQVHWAGTSVRARVRHDHGIDAMRDRQRLSVHQGGAHHQRLQVRWTARLFPVQRAFLRWPEQLWVYYIIPTTIFLFDNIINMVLDIGFECKRFLFFI